ncbi:MAG: hypothetical protein J6A58_12730 [Oscillospiraceae bacterium]|nr:hypothetical protein [Oscillospiraceae bacterium]
MPNQEYRFFQQQINATRGIPRYALAGTSGAGKSRFGSMIFDSPANKYLLRLMNNVQSTKIKTQLIPIIKFPDSNSEGNKIPEDTVFFEFNFSNQYNILQKTMRDSIANMTFNLKDSDGFDDESEKAVNSFMTDNTSKTFDITKYCSEDIKKDLKKTFSDAAKKIISGDDCQGTLEEMLKKAKQRADSSNKEFNKLKVKKELINKRLSLIEFDSSNVLNEIFKKIQENFKEEIEKLSKDDLIHDKITLCVNDENTSKEAIINFLDYLKVNDGKHLIVSQITFAAKISKQIVDILNKTEIKEAYKHKIYEKKNNELFYTLNKPPFVIYDLMGLEKKGDEGVDSTIENLKEIMPDMILAFHNANTAVDGFNSFLVTLKNYFKGVPICKITTHIDQVINKFFDNKTNSSFDYVDNDDNEAKYYIEAFKEAFKKYTEDDTKDNINATIACSLVDNRDTKYIIKKLELVKDESFIEEQDFNGIESTKEKYYIVSSNIKIHLNSFNRNKIFEFIGKQRFNYFTHYNKLQNADITLNESDINNIEISFKNDDITKIAEKIVKYHNSNASKNYYRYINSYPHWNTIYKWRDMHVVGLGWSSSAKVYDNISIYVANFISEIMSRTEILEAINIKINIDSLENDTIKAIENDFKHNIEININQYNGFFYYLRLMLTYKFFADDFNKTYFWDALNCIHDKLSDTTFVEAAMKKALEDYSIIFKNLTC